MKQSERIVLLQQELETARIELEAARNELQQTLDELPTYVAQAVDQQLDNLLANPRALQEAILKRAQAATDPQHLFAALQSLQQLG